MCVTCNHATVTTLLGGPGIRSLSRVSRIGPDVAGAVSACLGLRGRMFVAGFMVPPVMDRSARGDGSPRSSAHSPLPKTGERFVTLPDGLGVAKLDAAGMNTKDDIASPVSPDPFMLTRPRSQQVARNLEPLLNQSPRFLNPRKPLPLMMATPGRGGIESRPGFSAWRGHPAELRGAATDSRGSIRIVRNCHARGPASGAEVISVSDQAATPRCDEAASPRPTPLSISTPRSSGMKATGLHVWGFSANGRRGAPDAWWATPHSMEGPSKPIFPEPFVLTRPMTTPRSGIRPGARRHH